MTDLASDVFRPAETIAYQDGAIVSRTILDNENGSVTIFAVAEGETISEHTAPHDALVQILEGEARITVSGESHDVAASEALLLPANEPHALEGTQAFKMLLTMVAAPE